MTDKAPIRLPSNLLKTKSKTSSFIATFKIDMSSLIDVYGTCSVHACFLFFFVCVCAFQSSRIDMSYIPHKSVVQASMKHSRPLFPQHGIDSSDTNRVLRDTSKPELDAADASGGTCVDVFGAYNLSRHDAC